MAYVEVISLTSAIASAAPAAEPFDDGPSDPPSPIAAQCDAVLAAFEQAE